MNRKFLPYLISGFLLIGISANYVFTTHDWRVGIFTPACFDAFAVGASLAYMVAYRQDLIEKIQSGFTYIAAVVFALFMLDVFNLFFLPARTVHSLLAATILYYCLFRNNHKFANYVLTNKWLIRLGKISYGVYLYHLVVPELWLWINNKFYSWDVNPLLQQITSCTYQAVWLFIQEFAFLLLLCYLSWTVIEKPINSLKRKFENKPFGQKSEPVLMEAGSIILVSNQPQT